MNEPKIHYGWYSQTQAEQNQKSYLYEDEKGTQLVLSEIKSDESKPIFDDAIFMGKVVKFIKQINHKL